MNPLNPQSPRKVFDKERIKESPKKANAADVGDFDHAMEKSDSTQKNEFGDTIVKSKTQLAEAENGSKNDLKKEPPAKMNSEDSKLNAKDKNEKSSDAEATPSSKTDANLTQAAKPSDASAQSDSHQDTGSQDARNNPQQQPQNTTQPASHPEAFGTQAATQGQAGQPDTQGTAGQTLTQNPMGNAAQVQPEQSLQRGNLHKENEKKSVGAASGMAALSTAQALQQQAQAHSATPSTQAPTRTEPKDFEQLYSMVDRLLVDDPQFQGQQGVHQVLLQLKDDVLPDTQVKIRREGDKLSVRLETHSEQSAHALDAAAMDGLKARLQGHVSGVREVSVELEGAI